MPTTTGYECGDVVLVPFPFTDQSTTKRRPAVVVSSDAYHRERPDLIILAVSSQARPVAGAGEAATIERGLVLRKLGRMDAEDRGALRKVLGEILGS
jgi:mRNA interferase MazF